MAGEIEALNLITPTHVVAHNASGIAGRATIGSVIAPRSFNIVAAIGDSTVEQIHLDSGIFRNRSA